MPKCCQYDHNNDGNCHIHSAPGVLRNKAMQITSPDLNTYEALANDLRLEHGITGGFVFVRLYDADDYNNFILGEDEIKALHKRLGELIGEYKL